MAENLYLVNLEPEGFLKQNFKGVLKIKLAQIGFGRVPNWMHKKLYLVSWAQIGVLMVPNWMA